MKDLGGDWVRDHCVMIVAVIPELHAFLRTCALKGDFFKKNKYQ